MKSKYEYPIRNMIKNHRDLIDNYSHDLGEITEEEIQYAIRYTHEHITACDNTLAGNISEAIENYRFTQEMKKW